ncbi:MAG: hypothetical protein HQL78_13195 [Magnetococcales bacterium]|nr:hypothetical protein [Magnetococcales bacterium]
MARAYQGLPQEPTNLPFVRKFYGNKTEMQDQRSYFDNTESAKTSQKKFDEFTDDQAPAAYKARLSEITDDPKAMAELKMKFVGDAARKELMKISEQRKLETEPERIKALDDDAQEVMRQYNTYYNMAVKGYALPTDQPVTAFTKEIAFQAAYGKLKDVATTYRNLADKSPADAAMYRAQHAQELQMLKLAKKADKLTPVQGDALRQMVIQMAGVM